MSRSINLTGQGAFSSENAPPMPPPTKSIPGVAGRPPMPQGKVVKVTNLTPKEQRDLKEALGWEVANAEDLPQNSAEIIQKVKQAMQAEIANPPLPVPKDHPPVKAQIREIDTLPPAEQQRVMQGFSEVMQAASPQAPPSQPDPQAQPAQVRHQIQQMAREEIAAALAAEQMEREALRQAERPQAEYVQRALQELQASGTIEDDRPPPETPPPQAETPVETPKSETGIDSPPPLCPHCGWDLNIPDDIPLKDEDKQNFLQSLLGGRPFVKEVPLADSQIVLTLRTLTVKEVDVVYRQAQLDVKQERCTTLPQVHEAIDRYRAILQLTGIRSDVSIQDLPDGLSPETNPHASGYWGAEATETDTELRAIHDYVCSKVLSSESLFRLVGQQVRRFNRLVSKLEVSVYDRDF